MQKNNIDKKIVSFRTNQTLWYHLKLISSLEKILMQPLINQILNNFVQQYNEENNNILKIIDNELPKN